MLRLLLFYSNFCYEGDMGNFIAHLHDPATAAGGNFWECGAGFWTVLDGNNLLLCQAHA